MSRVFDDDPGAWQVLTSEYLARKPWYTVRARPRASCRAAP